MKQSVGLLKEEFLNRLEDDYFHDLEMGDRPGSIREFVDFLSAGNVAMRNLGLSGHAQFPDLTDLSMTFADLLKRPLKLDGRGILIRTFYSEFVCEPLAEALVRKVASDNGNGLPSHAAFIEVAARDWDEWAVGMTSPERIEHLAEVLTDLAAKALGSRTLLSFFIKSPVVGKFSTWGPGASSGEGRKLPVRVFHGDGYTVSTSVSRYEEVECGVTAYEWQATLTVADAVEPDAAACGMAYVFDREDGEVIGGLEDLIMASDSMTDEDVLQAKAFITQHDDAADVIETSDLCFVWLWERRAGAEKGLGAKCLVAGLKDLQRRFKKIRTLILNAHPAQFPKRGRRVEPPMVAVERQSAVEDLVAYVHSIGLSADVRPVFTTLDNPQLDALLAVGDAINPRFNSAEEEDLDEDDDGIDLDEWADEISDLLRMAGLEELAVEVDDGVAPYEEVETALKYLVFEPHVQYLRVSSSGNFELQNLGMDVVPHQVAHEMIAGIDEFCEHLPENMRLASVEMMHDYVVCTVEATTPFGQLIEYFTLIPKPRPININSYFSNLW